MYIYLQNTCIILCFHSSVWVLQLLHIVALVSSIIVMLAITFQEYMIVSLWGFLKNLIYLNLKPAKSLHPFLSPLPPLPTSGNHQSGLYIYEFSF